MRASDTHLKSPHSAGEDSLLHLNEIFQAEGLEPNLVQLVRHKDQRFQKEGKSVFDVWYSSVRGLRNTKVFKDRRINLMLVG